MPHQVLYTCDRRACEFCGPECHHTQNIAHAANFQKDDSGNYVEKTVPTIAHYPESQADLQSFEKLQEVGVIVLMQIDIANATITYRFKYGDKRFAQLVSFTEISDGVYKFEESLSMRVAYEFGLLQ